jgi:hypothetical protein
MNDLDRGREACGRDARYPARHIARRRAEVPEPLGALAAA